MGHYESCGNVRVRIFILKCAYKFHLCVHVWRRGRCCDESTHMVYLSHACIRIHLYCIIAWLHALSVMEFHILTRTNSFSRAVDIFNTLEDKRLDDFYYIQMAYTNKQPGICCFGVCKLVSHYPKPTYSTRVCIKKY